MKINARFEMPVIHSHAKQIVEELFPEENERIGEQEEEEEEEVFYTREEENNMY